MNKERLEKIIKNQDRLVYYSFNNYDEGILFDSDIETNENYAMFLQENKFNEEFLSNLSTENLMMVFADGERESQSRIIESEIMKRSSNGEIVLCGNDYDVFSFLEGTVSSFNSLLKKFKQENKEIIENKVLDEYENTLKMSNPRAYNILSKTDSLLSKGNFLRYYENGTISDDGIEMMENIYANDISTFKKMNFGLVQDQFLGLGEDIITHIAKYPELTQKLFILQNNAPKLFDVFTNEINSIKSKEHISTVYEEIRCLLDKFSKNHNILQELPDTEDIVNSGLQNSNLFEEYLKSDRKKSFNDFLDEQYKTLYKPRPQDKLEIFLAKYFSISLNKAQKLVESYGEDVESIKQDLNSSSLNVLSELKDLLETEDLEKIDNLYNNYKNKFSAKDMIICESDFRQAYAKTYTEAFEKTKNKINNLINQKSDKVNYVQVNGKNIPIVKISGKFNVFVHSSDTGFKGNKNIRDSSFKKNWCETDSPQQHLVATTNIDENFQGVAPIGENGVYYGFLPQNPEDINLIGNQDINSHVRSSNYSAEKAKYISAEKMNYYSRRVYSESAIEKRMPDCIVIYNDMKKSNIENSYKAAEEFEVPIVYIDKRELVKEQKDNILNLISDFKENQSIDTLEKIIKTYETNKAGWLLNREKSDEHNLTDSIDNSEFQDEFNLLGKQIGGILRGFKETASKKDLFKLRDILVQEQELYKDQNQNNVPFSKVKMTDEFEITLQELSALAIDKSITFEEVKQEERFLEQIEKGLEERNKPDEQYQS